MRAWGQALLMAGLVAGCVAGRGLRAQTTEKSKGEISGTVFDSETLQPLNNATVTLMRTEARAGTGRRLGMVLVLGPSLFAADTDSAGKFVFHDLDAGQYRLRVMRNGYVDQGFGGGGSGGRGSRLTLETGEKVNDLKIGLTPAGVVTGRVADGDGEPMPWVNVQLLAVGYNGQGVEEVRGVGSATTNDLGQYRVFGVAPGQYYVQANYTGGPYVFTSGVSAAARMAYPAQLFYPGTTDPTNASEITVTAGQDTAGIDFSLRRSPVYTVSGKVTLPSAPSGNGSTTVVVTTPYGERHVNVIHSQESVQLFPQGVGLLGLRSLLGRVDGDRFEFRDVPAGSYTLTAWEGGPWAGGGAMGRIPVSVGADVSGLSLTLQLGFDLHGQLSVEGQTANLSKPTAVFLDPASRWIPGGRTPARVGNDGSFVWHAVFPGSYWLDVAGVPPNEYVKSIRLGTQDGLAKPLDIPQGGTGETLTIVIGANGAGVAGSVIDANDKAASDATVVLVPDAPLRGAISLYQVATTDQNGNFSMGGIRPGGYDLFAWENVEQNAWFDPAFLKAAESSATAVDLSEGQAATVTLHEISGGESAQQ